MALSKQQINFIFAVIVIVLGTTAVISYKNSPKPVVRSNAPTRNSDTSLPKDHPPIDEAEKLASLIQMSSETPENADIQSEIGNIYYDLGEYDKAVGAYRKSLDIRPGDPYVGTDLATCLHYLGQNNEALEILDKILQTHPDFFQALYNKGVVLIYGTNDVEGGIGIWENLLESDLNPTKKAEIEQNLRQLKSSVR